MDVQTRSATANRSRVSIRVTTTFGQVSGVVDHVMVDPVNTFLTSSLTTVQNLVVVSHAVCLHLGAPQKFLGCRKPAPWDGAWLTPDKDAHPHIIILPNVVVLGQTVT